VLNERTNALSLCVKRNDPDSGWFVLALSLFSSYSASTNPTHGNIWAIGDFNADGNGNDGSHRWNG